MKEKKKLGLVPKLIIAIILGILIGQFLPEEICRIVVTLSGLFSSFLKFVIPLMINASATADSVSRIACREIEKYGLKDASAVAAI